MAETDDIPHFDVDVLPDSLEDDFTKILEALKPNWKREDVKFEKSELDVSRGLMNTMVKCYDKNDPSEAIMIRVHNVQMNEIMNRKTEVIFIKYFMKMDCAPKILATFKTGFCYEYIHGEILNSTRIGEEPIWRHIAEKFARFHSGDIDHELIPKENTLHKMFEKLWPRYPSELPDPEKNRIFKEEFPSKEELQEEVNMVMDHCLKLDSPLTITHNDTRGENIIWNAELDELKFVDFEIMSYGFRAAELACHFCRYCGLQPPDYSLLPDEQFQSKWLRHYLEKYNEYTGEKTEVTDKDVRKLYVQIKKFHLLFLILNGLGGPVMEAMNVLEGKDNLLYVLVSVKEYYKRKDEILSLTVPE